MVTAVSVLRCTTELSARRRRQLLAVPCLKVKCRDALGADGCWIGLTFHDQEQAKTQHSARSHRHGGVSQRRGGWTRTVSITRDQRDLTGDSSSALARARIASREYSGSLRASLRSRAIADTPRNSSTWTGENLSHPREPRSLAHPAAPRRSSRTTRRPVRRSQHGPSRRWGSYFSPAAPCGVDNDPEPAPRTSSPSAGIPRGASRSPGRRVPA